MTFFQNCPSWQKTVCVPLYIYNDMKGFFSKIWEWLTMIFAGIVVGVIIAFKVLAQYINNQDVTVKKLKTKGDDADIDLKVNESSSTAATLIPRKTKRQLRKEKRRTRKKR